MAVAMLPSMPDTEAKWGESTYTH